MFDTQATEWDNDLQPVITINNLFSYAGHTMTIGIFEDLSSGDISWSAVSTWATPIKSEDYANSTGSGVYPVNFAEIEACQSIEEVLEVNLDGPHSTVSNFANAIMSAITNLLVAGQFQEVR